MKRIILSFVFLLGVVGSMFGQSEKYLYACCDASISSDGRFDLSGDTWGDDVLYFKDLPNARKNYNGYFIVSYNIGKAINYIIDKGYKLVNTITAPDKYLIFQFTRTGSSVSRIERIYSHDDDTGDVKEIARYNLQGIPVTKADKGLQIVVYSNYTTKTVVVE